MRCPIQANPICPFVRYVKQNRQIQSIPTQSMPFPCLPPIQSKNTTIFKFSNPPSVQSLPYQKISHFWITTTQTTKSWHKLCKDANKCSFVKKWRIQDKICKNPKQLIQNCCWFFSILCHAGLWMVVIYIHGFFYRLRTPLWNSANSPKRSPSLWQH